MLELKRRGLALGTGKTLQEIFPPQPGPQTEFTNCQADILVYGGQAGGGKSQALLSEPTKFVDNPGFGATIFRRKMKQVTDEGGLWDQSTEFYPRVGAKPNLTERYWIFPSGAKVSFEGCETEASKHDYQGSQICLLEFDELLHFTESQFFYLITRNRSLCGIKPRVRATCNPGPGWVKRLLAPWVDKKFPNPAESGEIRWFVRKNSQTIWVDAPPPRDPCDLGENGDGCLEEGCERCFPPEKSITFIRASVYDNKILLRKDPGYITNLQIQNEVDKRRLLYGDWDAKPAHLVIEGFDEIRNVVPYRKLPSDWRIRAVGADFGSVNAAEVLLAEDPDNKNLYIFAEDWPGHWRPTDQICNTIRELCGGTPTVGCGGNRTVEQGSVESYKLHGIPLELPLFRDVAVQYQCVNDEFFANRLYVMAHCQKTIDMLTSLQRDIGPDGFPLDTFDDTDFHLLAALRYIISKLRPPKEGAFNNAIAAMKALADQST